MSPSTRSSPLRGCTPPPPATNRRSPKPAHRPECIDQRINRIPPQVHVRRVIRDPRRLNLHPHNTLLADAHHPRRAGVRVQHRVAHRLLDVHQQVLRAPPPAGLLVADEREHQLTIPGLTELRQGDERQHQRRHRHRLGPRVAFAEGRGAEASRGQLREGMLRARLQELRQKGPGGNDERIAWADEIIFIDVVDILRDLECERPAGSRDRRHQGPRRSSHRLP